MKYIIIIYKLQWFTGERHKKGEAKYNKCKKGEINTKTCKCREKKSGRTDIVKDFFK